MSLVVYLFTCTCAPLTSIILLNLSIALFVELSITVISALKFFLLCTPLDFFLLFLLVLIF